jgi:hypothetical protein
MLVTMMPPAVMVVMAAMVMAIIMGRCGCCGKCAETQTKSNGSADREPLHGFPPLLYVTESRFSGGQRQGDE